MPEPVSAVVVGSKGFLDAVEAPLRMRLGCAPHVAGNPQEVLLACGDGGRLFVLEYAGEPWIDLVKSLRVLRDDSLSIVAAVTPARAGDAGGLKAAGADEVVSWDGRADPVLWAVDRVVGRGEGATQPSGFARAAPVAIAVIGRVPTSPPPAAAPSAPAASPEPLTWAASVLTAGEAEAVLLAARCGKAASSAARQVAAERVLAALSELERAALVGAEVPVDAALLRETAALRLRLALALAAIPTATPDDQPAAQALVAEVDAVLARLKAAAEASADAATLESIRRTLVEGGIALAGAVSRLVPLDAPAPSAPVGTAPAPGAAARVLSNEAEVAPSASGSRKLLWAVFAMAALATAGYHAHRLATLPPPAPQPRLAGAPASTVGSRNRAGAVVAAEPGRAIDPAELERFRTAEEARGNRVVEAAPGVFVSRPSAPSAAGGAKP